MRDYSIELVISFFWLKKGRDDIMRMVSMINLWSLWRRMYEIRWEDHFLCKLLSWSNSTWTWMLVLIYSNFKSYNGLYSFFKKDGTKFRLNIDTQPIWFTSEDYCHLKRKRLWISTTSLTRLSRYKVFRPKRRGKTQPQVPDAMPFPEHCRRMHACMHAHPQCLHL